MTKIQTPLNLGYHGKTNVYCMEGDGVSALYAIMMHYRPCDSVHVRSLKHTVSNAYLLFRKGDPEQVCNDLAHSIKECITLGVRLDWDITGQRITEIMSTRDDFGLYINKFMDGGDDPEDCAPTLQALMAEIIKVARYHSEGVVNPNNKLIANEMEFVFQKDEFGGKILPVESRHAYDTQIPHTPPNGGGGIVSSPDTMSHEVDETVPLGNYSNDQLVAFMANRQSRYSRPQKGGKGRGFGKGGKTGGQQPPRAVDFNPGHTAEATTTTPNRRIAPPIDPNACNGKGCLSPPQAPYRFCDRCHREGQKRGFIECKDGFKAKVAAPQSQKRAYEAIAEEDPYTPVLPWYETLEPSEGALAAYNATVEEMPYSDAPPEVTGPIEGLTESHYHAYDAQYACPHSPKRAAYRTPMQSPSQQMNAGMNQGGMGSAGLNQDRGQALWGFNQS